MSQQDLFDHGLAEPLAAPLQPPPVARARRDDPASSHDAAERMNASGATGDHAARILAVVSRGGGWTAWEITRAAGFTTNVEVSRRLSGINEIVRADASLDRACRVTGRKCSTYWLRSELRGGD